MHFCKAHYEILLYMAGLWHSMRHFVLSPNPITCQPLVGVAIDKVVRIENKSSSSYYSKYRPMNVDVIIPSAWQCGLLYCWPQSIRRMGVSHKRS